MCKMRSTVCFYLRIAIARVVRGKKFRGWQQYGHSLADHFQTDQQRHCHQRPDDAPLPMTMTRIWEVFANGNASSSEWFCTFWNSAVSWGRLSSWWENGANDFINVKWSCIHLSGFNYFPLRAFWFTNGRPQGIASFIHNPVLTFRRLLPASNMQKLVMVQKIKPIWINAICNQVQAFDCSLRIITSVKIAINLWNWRKAAWHPKS